MCYIIYGTFSWISNGFLVFSSVRLKLVGGRKIFKYVGHPTLRTLPERLRWRPLCLCVCVCVCLCVASHAWDPKAMVTSIWGLSEGWWRFLFWNILRGAAEKEKCRSRRVEKNEARGNSERDFRVWAEKASAWREKNQQDATIRCLLLTCETEVNNKH